MPVTQIEYVLDDGKPIVSKTDLKGKIVYVNPYFVEVSGFALDELLGAPHNLVRHPEMPPAAFEDMWRTLKAGTPWTGMVKNRRKNGDFYWVLANVTPIFEQGRAVGYMSVRSKPTRAQIEAADKLYRSMAATREPEFMIVRGEIRRRGLRGQMARLANLSAGTQLAASGSLLFLLFAALGLSGASQLHGAARAWCSALAGGGALLSWGLCARLYAELVRPLHAAIASARTIAGGDLNTRITADCRGDVGQLLQALQQMQVNLIAIIGDVRANVDEMTVATKSIAAGNFDLSARTEEQASNLEETAASMEQLAATVKQNADSAQQADQMVSQTAAVAVQGGRSVSAVGAMMNDISHSAHQIVDIISLIDGIAFQTNILALNAAVEAARAGEQGRGFAVVASEVRSLAQRTTVAAKEIKGLIDRSVGQIDAGKQMADATEATMRDIVQAVQGVATIVGEIALASREQSQGIEQINQAISAMDQTTQQNAAMVERAAAAAGSLDEQAGQLAEAVSIFKLRAGLTQPGAATPARAATRRALPVFS
nr:methyl-accepting chemotaxis protein [Massilia sp. TS11]